jgi:hypothetical protein
MVRQRSWGRTHRAGWRRRSAAMPSARYVSCWRGIFVRTVGLRVRFDPALDPGQGHRPNQLPQRTFPDDSHAPARGAEGVLRLLIPGHVAAELLLPELRIGRRVRCEAAAGMSVPEAPVNEYGGLPSRKRQIRAARQARYIDAESQSCGVQMPANDQLRFRIPGPDGAHVAGACARAAILRRTHFISDRLRAWPQGPISST